MPNKSFREEQRDRVDEYTTRSAFYGMDIIPAEATKNLIEIVILATLTKAKEVIEGKKIKSVGMLNDVHNHALSDAQASLDELLTK